VVDQLVQGMLETAGNELAFEIDRKEAWAGVDVLVAGHDSSPLCNIHWIIDIPFGSRHDA